MKKIFFILLLSVTVSSVRAQYFEAFGNGDGITGPANGNPAVYKLCTDTTNHLLFVMGTFRKADDSIFNGTCVWNGTNYSPFMNFFSVPTSSIANAVCWGSTMVAGWDNWLNLYHGTILYQNLPALNGNILDIIIYNNELYAAGEFTSPSKGIVKWNGTNWETVGGGLTSANSNNIQCLGVYSGDLIAAGDFDAIGGISANHIARWNGFQWQSLGVGISSNGGGEQIQGILEFYGKLWIAGVFDIAGGLTCSGIANWDGLNWYIPSNCKQIGFGYSFLSFYRNKLFISGKLTDSTNSICANLSSYDGSIFNFYPNECIHYSDWIITMKEFEEYLYLGGYFTELYYKSGNDTIIVNAREIARFSDDSVTGFHEVPMTSNETSIYPNPVNSQLTIDNGQLTINTITVTDVTGREVLSYKFKVQSSKEEVDVSGLVSGIYFLRTKTIQGSVTVRKFVKE